MTSTNPSRAPLLLVFALTALAVLVGCGGEPSGSAPEEILVTEEVGGAIDSELSTDDDPRGRRRDASASVLPPGFPVDLPLPGGASVTESGQGTGGAKRVVLETPTPALRLAQSWTPLLESEGWTVVRSGELTFEASRTERNISVVILDAPPGSRVRIDY